MMSVTHEQLVSWLGTRENERLEFKEARNTFKFENVCRYCIALVNEGGGALILGVDDGNPRRVVGTAVFQNLAKIKTDLYGALRMSIDAASINHPDGRVVVFLVPSRPLGAPLEYKGQYLMRSGDGLVSMTPDRLRRILDEVEPDFSTEVCPGATLGDLDPAAIQLFRDHWRRKSDNRNLDGLSDEQLLFDAEVISDDGITHAALILMGTGNALRKYVPQAEVIFEYRNDESSIRFQQREEFREGFLLFLDDLWRAINLRNDVHHFQDGLFLLDIPTFNAEAVREAILNSVAHRDYRRKESVFIRQYPSKLLIESPGGFPPGITVDNILSRQSPRNRCIAAALSRCGLVERSGQGMDLMFDTSIREGKLPPDFVGTDDYQVNLTLHGDVQDPRFLRFLERVSSETQDSFAIGDLIILDLIHREQDIPATFRVRLPRLRELGVIEARGRGRGVRYLLSRRFYDFTGRGGAYTRRLGLDRDTNKELLLKHIESNVSTGCQLSELGHVLPMLNGRQIQSLLAELKDENRVYVVGRTRAARWFAGSAQNDDENKGFNESVNVQSGDG